MMQIPDLTVKHLGAPTIPSPLTGVKFIPENATVIYAKDVNEVEEELKNTLPETGYFSPILYLKVSCTVQLQFLFCRIL